MIQIYTYIDSDAAAAIGDFIRVIGNGSCDGDVFIYVIILDHNTCSSRYTYK